MRSYLLSEGDEVVREHCYLVARGVRPMAHVGCCPAADEVELQRLAVTLSNIAGDGGPIPFVVTRGDGIADYGFAACSWVIDLFRWATKDAVPPLQRDRIVGLLLGYSSEAIARYCDRAAQVTSVGLESTKQPSGSASTEESAHAY